MCTRSQLCHLRNSIRLFNKSDGDREQYRRVRERVPRVAASTYAVLSDEDAAALQSIEESEAWKNLQQEREQKQQQLAKERQETKHQQLELASKMGLPEGWAVREYRYAGAGASNFRIDSPDRKHCFSSKKAAFEHAGVEYPQKKERRERQQPRKKERQEWQEWQERQQQLAKERQEWWQQRAKERQ